MAVTLILSIVSGAVGGNMLSVGAKKLSLGTVGNSLVGAIGGWFGSIALGMFTPSEMAAPLAGMDAANGVGQFDLLWGIVAGAAAGVLLVAIVSMAKNMMSKAQ